MKTIKVNKGGLTNKTSDKMKYYYRRGDRYFFRGVFGKLVISGCAKELQLLKRGEEYIVECEY